MKTRRTRLDVLTVRVGKARRMAAQRRPRGSLKQPVQVHWDVESDSKAKFDAMALRANVSSAVFFELVVKHIELDESGLPLWWAEERSAEELPIDTA